MRSEVFSCDLGSLKELVQEKCRPLWKAQSHCLRLQVKSPHIEITQHSNPFPAVAIDGLFPSELLQKCQRELLGLQFEPKKSDLYNFNTTRESLDFAIERENCAELSKLKNGLYSKEFTDLISTWTGAKLVSGKIDMAGQIYPHHGYLACHDDDIRESQNKIGRRVAFILYLVKSERGMNSSLAGGELELFGCDGDNQPKRLPSTKISPLFGRIAFFSVTPTSYHRVAEILASDFQRITITGWFYGPIPATFDKTPQSDGVNNPLCWMSRSLYTCRIPLEHVVNAEYLNSDAVERISSIFVEESSIALKNFIKPELFNQAVVDFGYLESSAAAGPINRRNFLIFNPEYLPMSLRVIWQCLNSDQFYQYLCSVTQLDGVRDSLVSCLRQFVPGNYTLLHDDDSLSGNLGTAHVSLMLTPTSRNLWHSMWGGASTYIARDSGSTLMRLYPIQNTLSVVYILPETAHFIEYVNSGCKTTFYNGKTAGRAEFWSEFSVLECVD